MAQCCIDRSSCNRSQPQSLFSSNQLASVAVHGEKLPSTTLTTSAYITVRNMQRFGYIFNTHATAGHALVRLEAFGRIYLL